MTNITQEQIEKKLDYIKENILNLDKEIKTLHNINAIDDSGKDLAINLMLSFHDCKNCKKVKSLQSLYSLYEKIILESVTNKTQSKIIKYFQACDMIILDDIVSVFGKSIL